MTTTPKTSRMNAEDRCRRRARIRAVLGSAVVALLIAVVIGIAWGDGVDPTVLVIFAIAILTIIAIALSTERRGDRGR